MLYLSCMSKLSFFSACFLLLLFTVHSEAQELTLKAAIEEGLNNSPTIKKAESSLRENTWKKREGWSTFLPTVTSNITYLTDKRYVLTDINFGGGNISVPQILPTSSLTLTATYPLFEGGAGLNRLHAGQAFERSAEDELQWARFKLAREILVQYYKVLGAKQLKEVAEQNITALTDHLRDVKLFKKVGAGTNYDVLKVEVQLSEAQTELLNRVDDIEIQKRKLSELLGQENGRETSNAEVTGTLPVLDEKLLSAETPSKNAQRLDLQAMKERSEALHSLDSAANKAWIPRLNLYGQYFYYNNLSDSISNREDYRDAHQIGLQLNWAFFDGLVAISRAKQAAEQSYQNDQALRTAQIHSQQDADLWTRKYKYFCLVYKSRVTDVEKATESVRLATQGRRVGTRTNVDLLDTENELYRAKAGVVTAQLGFIDALVNLELATGHELHNFF